MLARSQITIDAPKAYFLAKLTYPTAFVVDQQAGRVQPAQLDSQAQRHRALQAGGVAPERAHHPGGERGLSPRRAVREARTLRPRRRLHADPVRERRAGRRGHQRQRHRARAQPARPAKRRLQERRRPLDLLHRLQRHAAALRRPQRASRLRHGNRPRADRARRPQRHAARGQQRHDAWTARL